MDTIQELEKKLRIAKHEAACKEWSEYYLKIKTFAETLVGKCILQWYTNREFGMYKVTGYTPVGYMGDHVTGRKWIELQSTDFIRCIVPDSQGRQWRVDVDGGDVYSHQFVYTSKRKNESQLLNISRLTFINESIANNCCSLIQKSRKIGYFEGDLPPSPNYDQSLSHFIALSKVIPNNVYDELRDIYMERVQKTLTFWEKHSETISKAIPLSSFYK